MRRWSGVKRVPLLVGGAVTLLILVAALSAYPRIRTSVGQLESLTIDPVDLAKVRDGDYEGEYDGGLVKAKVRVSVSGGRITSLVILKHDHGRGKKAESLAGAVVRAQSLAVDAVSGATHSSKVILKATELALKQPR